MSNQIKWQDLCLELEKNDYTVCKIWTMTVGFITYSFKKVFAVSQALSYFLTSQVKCNVSMH